LQNLNSTFIVKTHDPAPRSKVFDSSEEKDESSEWVDDSSSSERPTSEFEISKKVNSKGLSSKSASTAKGEEASSLNLFAAPARVKVPTFSWEAPTQASAEAPKIEFAYKPFINPRPAKQPQFFAD
jgi:hypothetical protein